MASQEELEWWNKFADVMAEEWMLTPQINRIIRTKYEEDYAEYLFKPQGTFLEIGCGVGWIGQKFALRGMQVDGIDFSESQLDIARQHAAEKNLTNVAYFVRDIVNDPLDGRFQQYDCILINAVLHHLSEAESSALMARVAKVLAPGGKLYIYEPISPRSESAVRRVLFYPVDFVIRVMFFALTRGSKILHLRKQNFSDAMAQGYTGSSPDERPIPIAGLRQSIAQQGLDIVEERPYHSYSLGFAMSIVRLKPKVIAALTPVVQVFYRLDLLLFKAIGWQNLGDDKSVLCGIKAMKSATANPQR